MSLVIRLMSNMNPLLIAHNSSYRYPQHGLGLAPTSLTVSRGTAVYVNGASGCGKSTLARCLAGFIPHLYRGELSGSVTFAGHALSEMPLWQISEHVGLVLQNPAAQMLAQTVEEEIVFGLENLGLPRAEIKARLNETMAQFGLTGMRQRNPQTLSGGEQQKLALAAIMARQPEVLVLDEPFSMLDTTAATELTAALVRLVEQGTAVVVCEHRGEYIQALPSLHTLNLNSSTSPQGLADAPKPFSTERSEQQLMISKLSVRLGGKLILRDMAFNVAGGEVTAVVGKNGSGKTTLLRALTSLQTFEGSIQVNGTPPQLGVVFQNPDMQLFNSSVREEILYRVPNPDMSYYNWLIQAMGLANYEDTPPLLLSEGEKKRVALATILMQRPRHGILLDEPSLGQDIAHKQMLMGILRALAASGQIVMLTTHDLWLATQADRLLVLADGDLVGDGRPSELVEQADVWQKAGLILPSRWTS